MAMSDYFKVMWSLIKSNHRGIITIVITVFMGIYLYACQSTTRSLIDPNTRVSREELQIELETIQSRYKISQADLDKQDAIKKMLLENAILIASGSPLNPLGVLSGIAAIYGITAAGSSVVSTVKKNRTAKTNNTDIA